MSTRMRQTDKQTLGAEVGSAATVVAAIGERKDGYRVGRGEAASQCEAQRDPLSLVQLLVVGGATAAICAFVLCWAGLPLLVAAAFLLAGAAAVAFALTVLWRFCRKDLTELRRGFARAQLLAQLNSSIIGSFAMAVDAKDQHTQGHTERVRELAVLIGRELRLTPDEIEALRMAAMLHDIGKLAVPDYILSKPTALTQEEMRKVQTHTLVGAALLESVEFPWPVVPVIRSHHEWFDGTGYPDGTAGEAIPLGGRILAVADVYDALLSHRPYRPAMQEEAARKFMRERSGTQFDPRVINVCFRVLTEQQGRVRPGFIFDSKARGASPEEIAEHQTSIFMDIKQAHQELLALYGIVQTMGQSLDLQETMELVMGKTKRIIDFATCVLFLRQEDGYLLAAAAAGPHAEEIKGRRLPLGGGVSGLVAHTGEASGLGRSALEDLNLLLGPEAESCRLAHIVSAPLLSDHPDTLAEADAIGALTLYRPGSQRFSEDDLRLAVAVAGQAAVAIKNAGDHEATRRSAMTDQLTGLANARYFFMRLEQELSRAKREHKPVSLIAVDLNGLKQINDSHGHQQGDRALRMVAEVFRGHVRDYDVVVRYAGDEFFIILPDTTNKVAVETVQRIKEALRGTYLEVLPGREIGLSASFGVATFPGDAEHADALIAVADQAMYADKRLNYAAARLSAESRERERAKDAVR